MKELSKGVSSSTTATTTTVEHQKSKDDNFITTITTSPLNQQQSTSIMEAGSSNKKNIKTKNQVASPTLKPLPLLKIENKDANLTSSVDNCDNDSTNESSHAQPDDDHRLKTSLKSDDYRFPPLPVTFASGEKRRNNLRRQSLPPTLPPLPPPPMQSLMHQSPLASPSRAVGASSGNSGGGDNFLPQSQHHHHRHHHHHQHPLTQNVKPSASNHQLSLEKNLLIASRAAYGSLNSDVSAASSSVSSVESLLEIRRENPEEILMALGFGGSGNAGYGSGLLMDPNNVMLDPLLRIPGRFFEQPSSARGVDVNEVFRRAGGRMSPVYQGQTGAAAVPQNDSRVFHFPQRQPTIGEAGGHPFYYPYYSGNHHQFYQPPEIGVSVADSLEGKKKKNKTSDSPKSKTTPTSPKTTRKHPKVLVMGPKCYHFEPDDVDLYSPKSSSINELADDQGGIEPPFSFHLSPRRASLLSVSGGGSGRRSRSPSIVCTTSPAASVSITSDFNETVAAVCCGGNHEEEEEEEDDNEVGDENEDTLKSPSQRSKISAKSHLLSVPRHYYPQFGRNCRSYRKLSCPNLELVYKSSNSNTSATTTSSTSTERIDAQSVASTIVPGTRDNDDTENDYDEDDCEQDHNLPTHSPRTHRSASVDNRYKTITYYPPNLNETLAERLKPLLAELSKTSEKNNEEPTRKGGVFVSSVKSSKSSSKKQQTGYHHLSAFIETALVTTIESLKLSLDFYRYFTLQEHSTASPPIFDNPDDPLSKAKKKFDKVKNDKVESRNKEISTSGKTPITTSMISTSPSSTSSPSSPTFTSTPIGANSQSLLKASELKASTTTSRGRSRSLVALERDRQSLRLQNLYLDVLDVEATLHQCLDRFKQETSSIDSKMLSKSSRNCNSIWQQSDTIERYIGQLEGAVVKISSIQQSLRSLGSNYHRSLGNVRLETTF